VGAHEFVGEGIIKKIFDAIKEDIKSLSILKIYAFIDINNTIIQV
jgi:hypothetical protein